MEVNFIKIVTNNSPSLIVGDDDQALYGFKHASADYIRNLATNSDYERFELPYCSRCTEVLVAATHAVIAKATALGRLSGRLDKRLECFLPTKCDDSESYPKIIHANCTVERNSAPYIGQYVLSRIAAISAGEIAESYSEGYPTVLVVGPPQFASRVYEYLAPQIANVRLKRSAQLAISPVDAYKRLVRDRKSRLGWRILLYLNPVGDVNHILERTLLHGEELCELLTEEFKNGHLAIADLLLRFRGGEALSLTEQAALQEALQVSEEALGDLLKSDADATAEEEVVDQAAPSVVVTSLVGAKGLQAGHVFVVGMNEGHFPRSNAAITDEEVCCLLVALTRATKSCTVVSCNRFGNQVVGRSVFLTWLAPYLATIRIDKAYFT